MKKITLVFTLLLSYFVIGQPTSAPTTPTQAQADVISVYSDAFTSAATMNLAAFTPAGNTANTIMASGNNVLELTKSAGGDFHGFDLSAGLDLSLMENMHYDIWIGGTINAGGIFNTTLSQHNGGHLTGQTAGYVNTNALTAGSEGMWISVDIPLSTFANGSSADPRNIISQIVFTHTNVSGPIYVDNVYFWRTAVNPTTDASLSDLTVSGSTVAGFSPATLTYNVELPSGTTMVPPVTGTATQAGTGSSAVAVTPAGALPGSTTVVVTAPDGTTTQTYTVNFTLADPMPTTAAPAPTVAESNALSIYSDAYSANTVQNFNSNAFAGAGTVFTQPMIAGDNTIKLENIGFYGAGWDAVDVSAANNFTNVRFHYWATPSSTGFRFFLIDQTAGIPGGNPSEPQFTIAAGGDAALVTGAWTEVVIPLSHFTNYASTGFSYDLTDIFQWKFDTSGTSATIYLDNVYFESSVPLSNSDNQLNLFAAYPNPSNNNWTIQSVDTLIDTIQVYDLTGKLVINQSVQANNYQLDGTQLAQGMYIAKISSENGSQNIKLIKE